MRTCPRCRVQLDEQNNFCFACGADLRGSGEFRLGNAPDPLVGQIVAERYRILELVGRGGMGVVYKVEHVRMGKLMAMKLLHGELASDRDVVKRFKTEAQAVSRLSHPNTVQVFDFGRSDGLMYLIMEFIDGLELARVVREEKTLSFPRCAAVLVQVCASLSEAHHLGIVHRDLKPENVLLQQTRDRGEMAKVLDFGLAKLRESEERSDTTSRGLLVGTPHYMSPEQIRGGEMDHRTDIYSLGAMMYKVVCGEPPFKAATPVGVLTKHLTEDVVPPRQRCPELVIHDEAEELIMRCMKKNPDDRFDSVDEIREELIGHLSNMDAEDLLPSTSGIIRRSRPSNGSSTPGRISIGALPTAALRVGSRMIEISSRSDFDKFERSLKGKRVLAWISAFVFFIAAAAGGAWYALNLRTMPEADEAEPNNQPADANQLWPDHPIRGTVGRRVSLSESDRDWFKITNENGQRVLKAELSGVPRMDLILQVFDSDVDDPLAEANAFGPSDPEAVTGVLIDPGEYFLLVREVWVQGRPPTENVSDNYELSLSLLDPAVSEAEPNDSHAQATKVGLTNAVSAYIGQPGDSDVFCAGEGAAKAKVTVQRPEGLELEVGLPGGGAPEKVATNDNELSFALPADRCFLVRAENPEAAETGRCYQVTLRASQESGESESDEAQ